MDARQDTRTSDAVAARRPVAGAIAGLAGLWLFSSALIWPNEYTASYNALMLASVVAISSMGLVEGQRAARWVLGVTGCWIIISLGVLSIFDAFTRRNCEVMGALLIVLALTPDGLRRAARQSHVFRRRLTSKA
jgi:hypothetical protein